MSSVGPESFPQRAEARDAKKELHLQLIASAVAAHRVQLRVLYLEVTIHNLHTDENVTIWTATWHP